MDPESVDKKLKYPLGVLFLVYNGFCDRFAYYGIKAVLILYLTNVLRFDADVSTQIYHLFFMFCTFIPLFGAMIADSFVGKFKTILIFTIVYIAGNSVLAAAACPPMNLPVREFSFLGLALLAIGTGCVKPVVVAFGGDQFKLPEQEDKLTSFFSVFYFAISAGGLIATFATPIFRKDVMCFGGDCYSLAFAATTGVMVSALVALIIGKVFYKSTPTQGNVIVEVGKCMAHAAHMKYKKGRSSTAPHWLDHAIGKYEKQIVDDIKAVLKVLVLYLPLPMFWALMEQQGSRWTLQASKMNGNVYGYEMKPDHIQVINPLLVLALIPAFDKVIYPGLAKINLLKKPMGRLAAGGILASVAFLMSGLVEVHLESNAIRLPVPALSSTNVTDVMLINKTPCNLNFSRIMTDVEMMEYETVLKNGKVVLAYIPVNDTVGLNMQLTGEEAPCNASSKNTVTINLNFAKVPNETTFEVNYDENSKIISLSNETKLDENYVIAEGGSETTLHMLWLLPQYITITIAEVMFAVTGMEFSYSQAPSSMKSVMQSAWLLTIACGNLIVAVIAKAKFFSLQSSEFFLFAFLMFVDILIFMWLASSYKVRTVCSKSSSKSYRDMLSMSIRNHPVMEKETLKSFRRRQPIETIS